jgi:hypothetical protein
MFQASALVTVAILTGGTIGALFGTSRAALAETPVPAEIATEVAVLGDASVTVHLQPFLTEEELATLRLVQTNDQALALFVPNRSGFAAIAASPEDGFIRDGAPVVSAKALAELPDAQTAADNAIAACNEARIGKSECVVVLEVAPAK